MNNNELNEEREEEQQEQDDLLNSENETPWGELEDESNAHQNL
jgi:hypothetical protein